jgi:hypothetical protein
MSMLSRRKVLASLGVFGGAAALGGCNRQGEVGHVASAAEPVSPQAPAAFEYSRLDPLAIGATAYRLYPDGSCMYAIFASVVQALGEKVGEPFRSFPVSMMRYGEGGISGWGTTCGVVNGAAALVGLLHGEKAKEGREGLINEFCAWYEQAALPVFAPKADDALVIEPSAAGSLLCHVSVSRWQEASGCNAFSPEKRERCRRLTADGAIKIVEILNRYIEGCAPSAAITAEVQACIDCHGVKNARDAMVKMDCGACHEFSGPHPLGATGK